MKHKEGINTILLSPRRSVMATATLATSAIISTLGRGNFYLAKALTHKDRAFIGVSLPSSSPASAPPDLAASDCKPSPISPPTLFPASPTASPFGFHRCVRMEAGSYAEELSVAVRVVQMACSLCQGVQEGLVGMRREQIKSKDDDSLVTVADWGVQATVSWILSQYFGSENVSIVAEEDAQALCRKDATGLLESVVEAVNGCLVEAHKYGLKPPQKPLGSNQVLEAIGRCNSNGGPKGRFWVLDPVDGTLGFVRGDQYAIALALMEDGEVVLGVLGCPNYPMKKQWLNYHQRYYRLISKLSAPVAGSWHKGCVMYAMKGSGKAWMQPLVHEQEKFGSTDVSTKPIKVSSVADPASATFCEPVEQSNSKHSFTAGLARSVGLRKQPLRVYSMVKYAAIACGDAEIFMKFARTGYKEKIWDHAAGVIIIHEAGGVVTDAGGKPLDFTKGVYLEGLDRGIIACSGSLLHEKIIRAVDASWDSSNL